MIRKVHTLVLALILTAVFAVPGMAGQKEESVAGNASVGVFSNYVWRGIKLSEGIVVQPSVTATYEGLSLNLWANMDPNVASDDGDTLELTETDVTASYSRSFGNLSVGAGYIYYAFDGLADTQEVYLSLGYATLLNPAITAYYDFDEGTGWYIQASIGHSINLTEKIALNLGASASYTADNAIMGLTDKGDEVSDFYNGQLTASLNVPVTGKLSVQPLVAYSFALSDDAEEAIKNANIGGDDDVLYGGVSLVLNF